MLTRAQHGPWAVVTGASAGIGKAFAEQLAAHGLHCVLAARREERLRVLSEELTAAHGIECRVVPVDLTQSDAAAILVSATKDLDIGLLVNNAGVGYAGAVQDQDATRVAAMVQLNCTLVAELTTRFLKPMVARGRGGILIVSSAAAYQPTPYMATYGATKGFELLYGEALWAELRGQGVDVLVLSPGSTRSEFHPIAGHGVQRRPAEPADVVRIALTSLGQRPSVVAGWSNWLCTWFARCLPRKALAMLAGWALDSRQRNR